MIVKDLRPKRATPLNGGRAELNSRVPRPGVFDEIRGALFLSAVAHGVLFLALLVVTPYLSSTRLLLPPVYTVNLVDLSGGGSAGRRAVSPETPQPETKKPQPPKELPKAEKPPEPKAEKPPPPPPKPKPEAPKTEMTLPTAKPKEPPKREEKRAEPTERQLAERKKDVPPPTRPSPEPARRPGPDSRREPERTPTNGGHAGAGVGPGSSIALGTPGGALSLDTAHFPFTYYLRQITDRIEQNWRRPEENVTRVVVYFRIKRDGTIVEPQVSESSRSQVVDLLAAGAVKRSEPFPPLPLEFGGDYLGIYLCFGIGSQCPGQKQG